MSALAIDHVYCYPEPSSLTWDSGAARLRLATSGGAEPHLRFFQGQLAEARQTADLLLALVRVVHSRFHLPPAMLSRETPGRPRPVQAHPRRPDPRRRDR